MRRRIKAPATLRGEISPPGDKSITHRADIFNSIAEGKARIVNASLSGDCTSTMDCMKALGVRIGSNSETEISVSGCGKKGLSEAGDVLNAGNSGTTTRMLAGLLSAQPFLSVITGDASLRSRPMGRVIHPLKLMGAQIWARKNDTQAPLVIRGGELHGLSYTLPVARAQLKSALLLAGLHAEGQTVLVEPVVSRDHSERMLKAMGAPITARGTSVTISAGTLKAMDLVVPGDISSAAFWLVAGAIHPDARIKVLNTGINPTRDGIIQVLRAMGASLKVENERIVSGEPVADITVESSRLKGIKISGAVIPRVIDELPVVAVAAAAAQGTTTIKDAGELRVKESDRISATVSQLSRLGADIEELPDGMVIHGGKKLRGALCRSHHDHRLAMSLAVAALIAEGETGIDGAEAASISYPAFWQELERLCRQ